eukprot:6322373-Ditylum_brightwellii.AAC.1
MVVDGDDDSVDKCVDDVNDESDYVADKHLTHLSQVVDCCLTERSKQNKHVIANNNDSGDGDDEGSGKECVDKCVDNVDDK